jgi:YrbI family 3-deoxy-D-manno-octulosonate 8-phosphate phosphatase
METLVVIPARGGSKGIPRKNVRMFAGKPLIVYTIEQALAARLVNRVVVSTDDPEIAEVSGKHGAHVIQRPAEISGDTATSEAALLHALEHLKQTEGYEPDLLVFLQCTSPLTLAEDIDGTVRMMLDENADSALSVTPFHYFLWRHDARDGAIGINHDKKVRLLRQQREDQFLETGAVYAMRVPGFLKARHRYFGRTVMHITPPERCHEIDEPRDLLVAEVLVRERGKESKLKSLPDRVGALVLDFDGVFTDNRVMVFQDGREAVVCSRSDGWGLAELRKAGLPILVLSTEQNPVVQARCDKLGIPCLHGVAAKLSALRVWLKERSVNVSDVVYVGNDVNDLACLQAVGCAVVVSDAHPEAKAAARIILSALGGHGAIRELADLIRQKIQDQGPRTKN